MSSNSHPQGKPLEKNNSFTWKADFTERRFPPGGGFPLSRPLERRDCVSFHLRFNSEKPSGDPGPEIACAAPHDRHSLDMARSRWGACAAAVVPLTAALAAMQFAQTLGMSVNYETRNTESKRTTILHKGFSASVQTIPWNDHSLPPSSWVSAELKAPPVTSSCSVFFYLINVLSKALSFLVSNIAYFPSSGSKATGSETKSGPISALRLGFEDILPPPPPPPTSVLCSLQVSTCFYFGEWVVSSSHKNLQVFQCRYGSWTEECQEYSKDTLQRNTACWFPRTFINSKGRSLLAVYVNGSSKEAVIKPLDQLFALHAIDRVNPPVNVTAEIERTCLTIQWKKPVSPFPIHCFVYEVKIYNTRKGFSQKEKVTTDTFIAIIDDISKYSIQPGSMVCRDAQAAKFRTNASPDAQAAKFRTNEGLV
ncbi:hypothetical protein CB1_000496004 [Camelus ferus]|nr:hypothetical protein CB1_000496004 [Camelus ferus]